MRRGLSAGAVAAFLGLLTLTVPGGADASAVGDTAAPSQVVRAASGDDSFRQTKTLNRTFTEADGTVSTISSNTVTVRADHTENLRGRQRVLVSWKGAQPSGGRASNPYGENGLQQEYPVVVMQCRGTDDPTLPADQQLQPSTCWTASVAQRSQLVRSTSEATWTHDAYADASRQGARVGHRPVPDRGVPQRRHRAVLHPPDAVPGRQRHPVRRLRRRLDAARGGRRRRVPGGRDRGVHRRGRRRIGAVRAAQRRRERVARLQQLGGVLDRGHPDRRPQLRPAGRAGRPSADRSCRKLGRFAPGSSNFTNEGIDQAVGPALWWSESNWRNRFTIPITFGLPPDACDVLDSRAPTGFYGSELLAQAALQWSPAYCLDAKRFKFQLNQMSDAAGFNLMESGEGPAAVVSSKHTNTGTDPVGYAPTAVTGFAVGYIIDRPDNAGEFTSLRLNARLIAKLLSQSYLGSDLGRGHPGMADNPLSIVTDPEFVKLNPDLTRVSQEAAATVLSLSNASDVIEQLTEYIAADADAAAFMAGKPDPYGMVVNPAYRDLTLPRAEWPLLDTYVPETQNSCRQANPSVYFTPLAAPVTTMRKISEALLDAWPNVQTRCDFDLSTQQYKIGRIDRQSFGSRFMLGIVSLGDAARYGLRPAALQTSKKRYVVPTDEHAGQRGRARPSRTGKRGPVRARPGRRPSRPATPTPAR